MGILRFKFEVWWTLEEIMEELVKDSWELTRGTIVEKLERLQIDLKVGERTIKEGRDGLKKKLIRDLEIMLAEERSDKTISKIIDTKISLNLEIDKDKIY